MFITTADAVCAPSMIEKLRTWERHWLPHDYMYWHALQPLEGFAPSVAGIRCYLSLLNSLNHRLTDAQCRWGRVLRRHVHRKCFMLRNVQGHIHSVRFWYQCLLRILFVHYVRKSIGYQCNAEQIHNERAVEQSVYALLHQVEMLASDTVLSVPTPNDLRLLRHIGRFFIDDGEMGSANIISDHVNVMSDYTNASLRRASTCSLESYLVDYLDIRQEARSVRSAMMVQLRSEAEEVKCIESELKLLPQIAGLESEKCAGQSIVHQLHTVLNDAALDVHVLQIPRIFQEIVHQAAYLPLTGHAKMQGVLLVCPWLLGKTYHQDIVIECARNIVAHEISPGHAMHVIAGQSDAPANFGSLLRDPCGFEGWACFAEWEALPPEQKTARQFYFTLYERIRRCLRALNAMTLRLGKCDELLEMKNNLAQQFGGALRTQLHSANFDALTYTVGLSETRKAVQQLNMQDQPMSYAEYGPLHPHDIIFMEREISQSRIL